MSARPESARILRPSSRLVPSMRMMTRNLHTDLLGGLDHTIGQAVAPEDAAEDIDEDGLDIGIALEDAEAVFNLFSAGSAAPRPEN